MSNTNICLDINKIHSDLLCHLQKDGRIRTISKQLSDLRTNADRVSFVHTIIEGYDLFPALIFDMKSDKKAYEFRQKGNLFYKNRKIAQALEFYTRSIANATGENEELALAYGNRSAALFEIGFYKECLQDIKRALEHNYPDNSKQKLFTRQTNAKKLETKQCENRYYQDIPIISEENKNPHIQSASNSVEIQSSSELGRHVVATKNIQIGEVVAVEKPFCTVLLQDITCHCYECLELCYNPLPCPNCTQALFCSEDCQKKAQHYHEYDCHILKTIRELKLDKMRLMALKIALITKLEFKNLPSDITLKESETYHSDRYKEIHNLVANTDQRTVGDLFKKSTIAAIVFELVKKFTTYLESEQEEYAFKEILLLHMQTAPCNFHRISEMSDNNGIFDSKEVGAGAFSFLSMFSHSCSPNVVRDCYGTTIVLRAIKSIRKGEQCFDNYGYHHALTPKVERQNELKEQYFFNCSCEACVNDWPFFTNLPTIETDISIDSFYYEKLMKGDRDCAKEVLQMILPRMSELEAVQPNKNFSEMQEVVKQCFGLLGSLRTI